VMVLVGIDTPLMFQDLVSNDSAVNVISVYMADKLLFSYSEC